MGAFSGMRTAKVFEKGIPLLRNQKEGFQASFLLEITKCEVIKRARGKGEAFIATFKVLESTCTDPAAGSPVGSTRTWFQSLQDADIAFGALLSFCAAVSGVDPSDKEKVDAEVRPECEDVMEAAADKKQQIFAGKRVRVDCVMIKTQEDKDFTRHNWAVAA